jgi:hypothetical protein
MRFTLEERATIAEARRIERAARERSKKARPARVAPTAAGQRRPRERDGGYLSWLHESLPCIACLIEGPPWRSRTSSPSNPIEAAHQKHTDLRGAALGRRPSDSASCPLCSWHHRLAPDACDPAQRKFWDRLDIDVGDFCRALYAAYQFGQDGAAVVRQFARKSGSGSSVGSY